MKKMTHAYMRKQKKILYYSVSSINLTQIKRYAAQILSYKIFSFLRTDPENRRK